MTKRYPLPFVLGFLTLNRVTLEQQIAGGYPPAIRWRDAHFRQGVHVLERFRHGEDDLSHLIRTIDDYLREFPFGIDPSQYTCVSCKEACICSQAWGKDNLLGYCPCR